MSKKKMNHKSQSFEGCDLLGDLWGPRRFFDPKMSAIMKACEINSSSASLRKDFFELNLVMEMVNDALAD